MARFRSPITGAVTAAAVFLITAGVDVYRPVPVGVLLITGFAAHTAALWCFITRAVGRAVKTWLAGTEMETALAGWPVKAADDPSPSAEVRHLASVRPAKHRRVAAGRDAR